MINFFKKKDLNFYLNYITKNDKNDFQLDLFSNGRTDIQVFGASERNSVLTENISISSNKKIKYILFVNIGKRLDSLRKFKESFIYAESYDSGLTKNAYLVFCENNEELYSKIKTILETVYGYNERKKYKLHFKE